MFLAKYERRVESRRSFFWVAGVCLLAVVGCGTGSSSSASITKDYLESKSRFVQSGWVWEFDLYSGESALSSSGSRTTLPVIPMVPASIGGNPISGNSLKQGQKWVADSAPAIDAHYSAVKGRMEDSAYFASGLDFQVRSEEKSLVKALVQRASIKALSGDVSAAEKDLFLAIGVAEWQMEKAKDMTGFLVGVASLSIIVEGMQNLPPQSFNHKQAAEAFKNISALSKARQFIGELATFSIELARFGEMESGDVMIADDAKRLPSDLVTDQGKKNAIVFADVWSEASKSFDAHGNDLRLLREEVLPLLGRLDSVKVKDQEAIKGHKEMILSSFDALMKVEALKRSAQAALLLAVQPSGSTFKALPPGDWTDPFTGRPLSINWNGDKVTVMSVGPNGKDDSAQSGKSDDIRCTFGRNLAN